MLDGRGALKPLGKLYVGILLVIFGGIILHAPLSVWLGSQFPDYELIIKAWKEILMGLVSVLALALLYRDKQFKILREPLIIAIAAYATLHLVLLAVFAGGVTSSSAGLLIDLRYLLFFVLVFVAVRLYPNFRGLFLKVSIAGAIAVVVFALLQIFVLPIDFLTYLGYGKQSIVPYLTIDQSNFIRISSTLRGPNPLGAYCVIAISGLLAWLFRNKRKSQGRWLVVLILFIYATLVVLWHSYSRSALIALAVALVLIFAIKFKSAIKRHYKLIIVGLLVVAAAAMIMLKDNYFISNVILHKNPESSVVSSSNEQHIESLQDGVAGVLSQPFGSGVGSVGSASLLGDSPYIIENQYLFIAHEVGWLGLALFALIFVGVMNRLWARRQDWLALSLFASGVGMAIIGVLLPVWVDDTVAIIWWGLAAVVLGGIGHGKSIDKKTA